MLGGSGYDTGFGMAIDPTGNAYVTGLTYSLDFGAVPRSPQAQCDNSTTTPAIYHGDAFVAKLPVDTDGDGLIDDWETRGLSFVQDSVTYFVDLPAMGADPLRKDVFVEIDWMGDAQACVFIFVGCTTHDHRPDPGALEMIRESFRNAGITLHIDAGRDSCMKDCDAPGGGVPWGNRSGAQAIPHDDVTRIQACPGPVTNQPSELVEMTPDTYTITPTAKLGWADFSLVPQTTALAPNQSISFPVHVAVPLIGSIGQEEVITLVAQSHTSKKLRDSDTTRITVVPQLPITP